MAKPSVPGSMASSTSTRGQAAGERRQRGVAVGDRLDLEALPGQEEGERLDDVRLVLHDHDPARHGAPPGPRRVPALPQDRPGGAVVTSVRARGPTARGAAGRRGGRRPGRRCRPRSGAPRRAARGSGSKTSMSRAMPSGRASATTRRMPPPERRDHGADGAGAGGAVQRPDRAFELARPRQAGRARPRAPACRPAASAVTSPARRPARCRSADAAEDQRAVAVGGADQRVDVPAEPGAQGAEIAPPASGSRRRGGGRARRGRAAAAAGEHAGEHGLDLRRLGGGGMGLRERGDAAGCGPSPAPAPRAGAGPRRRAPAPGRGRRR